MILLSLLQGITENTVSGDVLSLGAMRAMDMCEQAGVDMDVFAEVLRRYSDFSRRARRRTPLAF